MFIMVEGPDRAGKTTLVKEIYEAVNNGTHNLCKFKVVHCSAPKGDPFQEYLELFKKYAYQNVIFDRFYLGEYVYASYFRGKCKITPLQFRILDLLALQNSTLLIKAEASVNEIYKRCLDTSENLTKVQVSELLCLFNDAYSSSLNERFSMKYRSDLMTAKQFVLQNGIFKAASSVDVRKSYSYLDARGIGSLNPHVVLIGEEVGPRGNVETDYPFDAGATSKYLHDAISLSKLMYCSMYFTNAKKPWLKTKYKSVYPDKLDEELNFLNPQFIITLGKEALKILKKTHYYAVHNKKVTQVPHPSYWKRFHYSKLGEYVELLNGGIRQ